MIRRGTLVLAALLLAAPVFAQRLTGSLESSSVYGDSSPYQGLYSNNYIKLDYTSGSFSAGIQGEYYPAPLPGYESSLKGFGLPMKYISWGSSFPDLSRESQASLSITIGDFYGQFGSGVILRSWEDRDLGLANSIGGLRVKYDSPLVSVTALAGAPRAGLWYASSLVSGVDAELNPLPGLTVGGGIVDRYEFSPSADFGLLLGSSDIPKSVLLHTLRAGYAYGGLTVSAEYVGKGADFTAVRHKGSSDTYELSPGRAFMADISWSSGALSLTGSWRYLDNMAFRAYRTLGTLVPSNTLNYLPALCQQQTYMLASLNPYETFAEGENGFRGDAYYHFSRGSSLGGKYGMTLHVGGSWINALGKVLPRRDTDYLAYRDLNVDIKRKWNKRFKTTLFMSLQECSPTHGNRNATECQNVFVAEGQYLFDGGVSLRAELQYLYSEEREKDWMAGLAEILIAPHWSFSVSDMYNHGSTRQHYWNVFASWASGQFKAILGYGRNHEGMVCSGGVCRWQPEYKGAFLRIQYAF